MTIDVQNLTRAELEDLKIQVEKALVDAAKKDLQAALVAAEKAVADHGYSLSDITGLTTGRKGKVKVKSNAPARYSNPADPSQTWTGKGRQPTWFKVAILNGTLPEAMKI